MQNDDFNVECICFMRFVGYKSQNESHLQSELNLNTDREDKSQKHI